MLERLREALSTLPRLLRAGTEASEVTEECCLGWRTAVDPLNISCADRRVGRPRKVYPQCLR